MLYFVFFINICAFGYAMNDLMKGDFNGLLWLCFVSNLMMLGKIALMDKELKKQKKKNEVKTISEDKD